MQVIDVRLGRLGVGEIMSTRLAPHHDLLGHMARYWSSSLQPLLAKLLPRLFCAYCCSLSRIELQGCVSDISATNGAASMAFV